MAQNYNPFSDAESVHELPDFNPQPLNGLTPEEVLQSYGVHVEVLGPWDANIKATPIIVAGDAESVRVFLKKLRSTWPTKR